MTFEARIPVRFGDEDHAGIVYFPRYLHYCHCAFEDFFAASGRTYREVLDEDKCGWPSVHLETEFLKPLRFGDELLIDVWVSRIGTKSATFSYRGHRAGEVGDIMRCKITVVCVDFDDLTSKPIPEFYRALFERHQQPPEGA